MFCPKTFIDPGILLAYFGQHMCFILYNSKNVGIFYLKCEIILKNTYRARQGSFLNSIKRQRIKKVKYAHPRRSLIFKSPKENIVDYHSRLSDTKDTLKQSFNEGSNQKTKRGVYFFLLRLIF